MKKRFLPFVFLLASLPTLAFSQTFSTPVQVSMTAGAHAPVMHVGRDGTVFVCWYQANADIYFSRSTDDGKTFSMPIRASSQVTTNQYTSMLQRAPEFVIDTKGTIHMVWTEARNKNPMTKQEQSDVWYIRSADNGATWTQPVSIMDSDDSMMYAQDFSAIACDSSDNLYVSYLDNRYLMRKTGEHYRMHLQKSLNRGMSWSNPVIADKLPIQNSGTCECCRQDIAVSPTGTVYIAFRTNMTINSSDEKRDIFVCRSTDGGSTFDSSIRAQSGSWKLMGCPTKGPHITLDAAENLHLSWNDARDDSMKLMAYYTMLRKGTSSVFVNQAMSNKQTQTGQWPDVAVGTDGILAVAVMPNTSGSPARLSYSRDGGNTWYRATFPGAASDDQEFPIIAFGTNGDLYSVWQDGTTNGIMFSKFSGIGTAQKPTIVTSLTPTTFLPGKPVRLTWTSPFKLTPQLWYSVTIIGPMGSTSSYGPKDTTLVIPSLPVGAYTYTITAGTTIGESQAAGSFTVAAPASVSMPENQKEISIYPNPSHGGGVSIRIPDLSSLTAHCQLINSRGEATWAGDIPSAAGVIVLPMRGLAKGVYQCQIECGSNHWHIPIIVE